MSDAMTLPSQLTIGALPPAQKSAIKRWYDSINKDTAQAAVERAKLHARAGIEGIRAGGESLMTGSILGAVAATLPDGLDYDKKYPIDAAAGALGIAASAVLAHESVGSDLRNVGTSCLAVFSFRKTFNVIAEMRKKEGKAVPSLHGDNGASDMGAEDPIIAAARML